MKPNKKNATAAIAGILIVVLIVCWKMGLGYSENSIGNRNSTENKQQETEADQTEYIPAESEEREVSEEELLEERITAVLDQMTQEQKVLQMFMITPEALTGYGTVTAAGDVTYQSLTRYPVGGIILFAQNILEPGQLTEMNSNLMAYSKEITGLPLFLAVDEEGGNVARIANNSNFQVETFSDMRTIGDSGDTSKGYYVGSTIGSYLHQYGFNLDFAPDADVLTNAQNQVIGRRSFGTDPTVVSEMSNAVAQGLKEQQVYACLKHFPGHGATTGDTHAGYSYTDKTLDEMMQNELVPFAEGIQNGISFLMVSHIATPQITGDNTPATLSGVMIQDILRGQLGYDGIVITDAMNMGAIANNYSSAEAAVKAVSAGVDIVLMPKDFESAYQGVLDALERGDISQERVNESVRRILRVKLTMQ